MSTETDLLDFARGPALEAALIILVFGVFWRLVGVLALRRPRDLSEPRVRHAWLGGVRPSSPACGRAGSSGPASCIGRR
jgi:hypothetical protein